MNNFDSYVLEFTDVLNNLKIVLKCDQLIDNLEKNKKEIILYKNHYELKKDQLVEKLKNNNMCPICYNSLEYETKIYLSECCTQKICTNCLEDWVIKMKKINCIYCNSENKNLEDYLILDKEYQKNEEIKSQKKNNDDYIQYNYSKMHFLENYIIDLKNKNDKILLFSDFSNVFNNIQIICEQNNILYEDLEKGNMQDIEKAVVNYKYGNAKILLANSSLFSCGMNLENSTHIIFVHKIDDSILDQVIGRAQRLGRTCILKVLSLEYENEIEIHKNSSVPFVEVEKNTTSIEKLENKTKIFNSIEELNNKVNEEIILPNYDEVLDINLDELLLNLDQDF
jgi:hypothetical protein